MVEAAAVCVAAGVGTLAILQQVTQLARSDLLRVTGLGGIRRKAQAKGEQETIQFGPILKDV